jgi:hypothetical protein
MDAVEGGQAPTVTRDGREIGELIPITAAAGSSEPILHGFTQRTGY